MISKVTFNKAVAELHFGDCFDKMKDLPDSSVDLVLCDLPFGTTQATWDKPVNLDRLWPEYWRLCKPNAAVILFAATPFDKLLGVSQIDHLRYEFIWSKSQPTGHFNSKKMPLKAHENILVFYQNPPTYNPIMWNSGRRLVKKRGRQNTTSELYGNDSGALPVYDTEERYPTTILNFQKDNRLEAINPTQKPVALLEWLIKTYTNEGDVVLDNTMGSGSCAVAALKTGRNFIGIEKEEEQYCGCVERVKSAFDMGPLFDSLKNITKG